jgi:uncharacterized protein (TIRG00374 family)
LDKKNIIKKALNIALPLLLGSGILWWMYRNFDFELLKSTLNGGMNWWWMAFSLIFGVTAQLFRGLRWRQTLAPLGEHPRTSTCIHAVFISYAASLIIPRIGEITRCGVLTKYDGTSFSKSLGTVVTERIIDSLLVLLITAVVFLSQARVFFNFFEETGTNLTEWPSKFTATGYIVTAICLIALAVLAYMLIRKLAIFAKIRQTINGIKEGILSLKDVKNKTLFTAYTLGIWGSYFLHYYITFQCFDFTCALGLNVALVSFIVGSIAVIVPTPNGMGPWHFAVKTILVLYGVLDANAETFVIIVHTIQTLLIPLLGAYSLIALKEKKGLKSQTQN